MSNSVRSSGLSIAPSNVHLYVAARRPRMRPWRPAKRRGVLGSARSRRGQEGKESQVAIYHLSAKIVSRQSGRSVVAAAAYRAGQSLTEEATGERCGLTSTIGAILVTVEAMSVLADSCGISHPNRVAGQQWPLFESN